MTLADELAKLHELQLKGALTDQEYARAKARLLESPPAGAGLEVNRLRRSRTDRWIGGVCGGFGRLTGVESWVWRLVFVVGLAFGGFTLLLYLVLWIFVPSENL